LGVGVKYIVDQPEELESSLATGLSPGDRLAFAGPTPTW
jgi:hypothetical protein